MTNLGFLKVNESQSAIRHTYTIGKPLSTRADKLATSSQKTQPQGPQLSI
jgi:hypothetical protein